MSLKSDTDVDEVHRTFEKYDRIALPVTDKDGNMLGIITIDDILDVAQREATRDIQKIGGSEALDAPYMDVGFWEMVKKRGGWLSALFLGEMLTATAMGYFEDEIEEGDRAGDVYAADYQQRRQLRVAGVDADRAGAGALGSEAARLVAGVWQGSSHESDTWARGWD